jgi:hypothetical protein
VPRDNARKTRNLVVDHDRRRRLAVVDHRSDAERDLGLSISHMLNLFSRVGIAKPGRRSSQARGLQSARA